MDDRQVQRIVVEKFEQSVVLDFTAPTAVLAGALDASRPVVYIRVDDETSAMEIWNR